VQRGFQALGRLGSEAFGHEPHRLGGAAMLGLRVVQDMRVKIELALRLGRRFAHFFGAIGLAFLLVRGANAATDFPTTTAASAGLNPAPLQELATAIGRGDYPDTTSVLVVAGGKLAYEAYFGAGGRARLDRTACGPRLRVWYMAGHGGSQILISRRLHAAIVVTREAYNVHGSSAQTADMLEKYIFPSLPWPKS
jgi:hypothetical protein